MPSKSKKLSARAIAALEAKRDIGAEILQSVKDMKAGKGKVVFSPAAAITLPLRGPLVPVPRA